jgi:hypothetical protein
MGGVIIKEAAVEVVTVCPKELVVVTSFTGFTVICAIAAPPPRERNNDAVSKRFMRSFFN